MKSRDIEIIQQRFLMKSGITSAFNSTVPNKESVLYPNPIRIYRPSAIHISPAKSGFSQNFPTNESFSKIPRQPPLNNQSSPLVQQAIRTPMKRKLTEDQKSETHKACNCKRSSCLKLYCDCFSNGTYCKNCNCSNCHNIQSFEQYRSVAIKEILDRNPSAFKSKLSPSQTSFSPNLVDVDFPLQNTKVLFN